MEEKVTFIFNKDKTFVEVNLGREYLNKSSLYNIIEDKEEREVAFIYETLQNRYLFNNDHYYIKEYTIYKDSTLIELEVGKNINK